MSEFREVVRRFDPELDMCRKPFVVRYNSEYWVRVLQTRHGTTDRWSDVPMVVGPEAPRVITRVMDDGVKTRDGCA